MPSAVESCPADPCPAESCPAGSCPADPCPADPCPADPCPADPGPADPGPPSVRASTVTTTVEPFLTSEPIGGSWLLTTTALGSSAPAPSTPNLSEVLPICAAA